MYYCDFWPVSMFDTVPLSGSCVRCASMSDDRVAGSGDMG